MLTYDEARAIVQIIVDSYETDISEPLVVVEPAHDFDGGWLFAWTSARWLETGDIQFAIGGNSPIAVFHSGEVRMLGTSDSIPIQLRRLNAGDY